MLGLPTAVSRTDYAPETSQSTPFGEVGQPAGEQLVGGEMKPGKRAEFGWHWSWREWTLAQMRVGEGGSWAAIPGGEKGRGPLRRDRVACVRNSKRKRWLELGLRGGGRERKASFHVSGALESCQKRNE